MHVLFAPAVNLLNRLAFRAKFSLIVVAVMIPVITLSVQVVSDIRRTNHLVDLERRGIEAISPLRGLLEHIAQHRGMTNALLKGDPSFREKIMQQRQEVDGHLAELTAVAARHGAELKFDENARAIAGTWDTLKQRAFSLKPEESFADHSALIATVLDTLTAVADHSNLGLDPVLASHILVDALTEGLPVVVEAAGQARGFGSGLVAAKTVPAQAHLRLSLLKERMATAQTTLAAALGRVFEESPEVAQALRSLTERAVADARTFVDLTEREVLNAAPIRIDAPAYFAAGTSAIQSSLALYDAALPVLDGLLAQRAAEGAKRELAGYATLTVVLLLVVYLLTALYLSIDDTLRRLREAATRLADGDLTVRLELPTRDETAEIGTSFNAIADGLSSLLHTVHNANDHLAEVSSRMLEVSQNTARGVENQMREIERAAAATHQMATAVQEVARNTGAAAGSAEQARRAATDGQQVVEAAISAIQALVAEVRRAAEAIERLEGESDNVSGVLEVIRTIADQTNLLALNAAIEAARAGEQGRGFAVVADEVRTLAMRTQQSTVEIREMIDRLQSGAQGAGAIMRSGGEQAGASVDKATAAGDALREITAAVSVISDMSAQIATAAREQSSVTDEISRNIANVTQMAEQTTADAKQASAAGSEVASLASEMNLLLGRFKFDQGRVAKALMTHKLLFRWDDSFVIGITEIDRQHRRLVDMVNELHFEMGSRRSTETLERILRSLLDYTDNHFTYEERLMREHGYPDMAGHVANHKKLNAQVRDFQRRFEAGERDLLATLLDFLGNWLNGHIKGEDKGYGPYLRAQGVK